MFTVITFTKDTKYIQQGLDLALKAVHERGLNNIDFDKTDFIDKCTIMLERKKLLRLK